MTELSKGVELEGRYVVQEHIGIGGYGQAWKATDKQLLRDVALKRLLKSSFSSQTTDLVAILAEARKHAQMVHTNIVQVYDIRPFGDDHIIIMEYVDGSSLHSITREMARKGEVLPLDKVMAILRDVLSGVSFAHERQTIHRDLSPANILLTSTGIPKIADFGIARVLKEATPIASTVVSAQGGTGNPHFMAPEQARGEPADFGSDLFTVGIVGYLLLAGRHPFAHPSGLFTVQELLQDGNFIPEQPQPPSVLSTKQQALFRQCASLVMRLLQREKASRFASAHEAIDVLDAIEPLADCPQCGERVPDHHRFCGFCGFDMSPVQSTSGSVIRLDISGTGLVGNPDELVDAGFRATKERNWKEAVSLYQQALALSPDHSRGIRNLAFALNRLGRYEEAAEAATRGLSSGGQLSISIMVSLLSERSFARANLKSYDDALSDINDVIGMAPGSPRALYSRARIYLFLGRREEAVIEALRVLKKDPGHAGALRIVTEGSGAA